MNTPEAKAIHTRMAFVLDGGGGLCYNSDILMKSRNRQGAGMKIRHAALEDLDRVSQIESESFLPLEGASRESIRRRLETFSNHFWLLETDQGDIAAFVNGFVTDQPDLTDSMYDHPQMHNEKGKWQMIFSVVTAPEYRGRGYAEKVLRQVIADSKDQMRAGLVLTCKEKLIHYYAKFGFVNEGISQSVHGNVTWYQMRLTF